MSPQGPATVQVNVKREKGDRLESILGYSLTAAFLMPLAALVSGWCVRIFTWAAGLGG